MLDQSFSYANFKTIYEIENRKGIYKKDFYSVDYHGAVSLISEKRKEIKQVKLIKPFSQEKYDELVEELKDLDDLREDHLESDLIRFSNIINQNVFNFDLRSFKPDLDSKTIYVVNKDAPSYFAMRQLQYNVSKTFKVRQANRYQIVKQVKIILAEKFPKFMIRGDIRQFYETVPQMELLSIVDNNSILSPKSKSLIKNLFYNYNIITNQLHLPLDERRGIPRGAGISAFLSEVYMRRIDEEIKNLDEVTFYARYVDDMIIVFTPTSKSSDSSNYLQIIKKIVEKRGLSLKDGSLDGEESKTFPINLLEPGLSIDLNFLGYKFIITDSKLKEVRLSDNKKTKYKDRLKNSIGEYLLERKYNEKLARSLLIHRFNYLTKNCKLHKPKKGLIGIYYSNSLIDSDCTCLVDLDQRLKSLVDNLLPHADHPDLNIRLKQFSFVKGFANKSFYNIESAKKNIPDLRSIVDKAYKPKMNNFERIVAAWKK